MGTAAQCRARGEQRVPWPLWDGLDSGVSYPRAREALNILSQARPTGLPKVLSALAALSATNSLRTCTCRWRNALSKLPGLPSRL